MIQRLIGKKTSKSTPFSDFIRDASSAEKKKRYTKVLDSATRHQQEIMRKAEARA